MRNLTHIAFLFVLISASACIRENLPERQVVPEGAPVTLTIGFGATTPTEVHVGTKAEAAAADETRVHDLYVLIFDSNGTRKYGRYFNYEHKWDNMDPLHSTENENEGWYVRNKTIDGTVDPVTGQAVEKTVGAVKIATTALSSCTLVLLANISNALVSLGDADPLDALNAVASLSALRDLPVRLEQNVVERNNLFLMAGEYPGLDMTSMRWDTSPAADGFGSEYRVTLSPLDAKVKFRIKGNPDNISELVTHKWTVHNVPSSCYLFPTNPDTGRTGYSVPSGDGNFRFDVGPVYFDGEDGEWSTFTFYMLESCLSPSVEIPDPSAPASYYLREKQIKNDAPGIGGYTENGDWLYAPADAPYVTFSASMTLTSDGIAGLTDWGEETRPIGVTGEMSYTVHLGDFTGDDANNYDTERGHFYTYDITLNNATNLYAEVHSFDTGGSELENQPGQEGALLLYSGGVVNCDAHYEYRMIEFFYNEGLAERLETDPDYHIFSWNVRTPFTGNGIPDWDMTKHRYAADSTEVDFLWVKFAVNLLEDPTKTPKTSPYSDKRIPYPGKTAYDYSWYPGKEGDVPELFDVNQLINYIYYQYALKLAHDADSSQPADIFDSTGKIRVTAFVDEYYYEYDPFTGSFNPDLWRKFVNAEPREMHILSKVLSSRDQQSSLINASHSIIQRSIQSIYNIDAPDLSSVWGVEYTDEIRETEDESANPWRGWDWGVASNTAINSYVKNEENGRLNSAALWGLFPAPDGDHDEWTDFLNYAVVNSVPELKDDTHRKMAYSCLTRNRDNNGDGKIDHEEIRWYMASINQLKGMWIGNGSLSTTARVYQPFVAGGDWRAHILSSTCKDNSSKPRYLVAEEGVATAVYGDNWIGGNERLRESVRCVRNVGTYTVGSMALDISGAPYDVTPDNYYTVEELVDPANPGNVEYSSYTLRFLRLDPKSLREYTDKELPFHDEKSANNSVYLELHTQSRASRATETPDYPDVPANSIFPGETEKIDMGTINEEITNAGYNRFCPAGYRLPNQKELAVMTMALPNDYWNTPNRVPCRTYSSYGYYAAPGQQKEEGKEATKLGWAYSGDIQLADRNSGKNTQESTRIRCVRDDNLTGTITGRMYLTHLRVQPGEQTTLNFNFSSSAAAFRSGTLYLCYNDVNGHLVETEIPLARQPDGLQYRTNQPFTVPDPESLSPSAGASPTDMRLKLVLSNVREGSETTFYTSFTVTDVDVQCSMDLLAGSDGELGFPVRIQAATNGDPVRLTSFRLWYRKGSDGVWQLYREISEAVDKVDYTTTVYFKPASLEEDIYFFKVQAATEEHEITSAMQAMEFLKVNYAPNQGAETAEGFKEWKDPWWQEYSNANGWLQSLVGQVPNEYKDKEQNYVISEKWKVKAINLVFADGDFIETDMDLSNCVFIDAGEKDKQDPGLDEILTFGPTSDLDWTALTTHFYYPLHSGNTDRLRIHSLNSSGGAAQIDALNSLTSLVVRLDENGISLDDIPLNWNNVQYRESMTALRNSSVVYIGSEEGDHRSRARYNYVRVVRKDPSDVANNTNGGFDNNPQNGGKL